jgi:glycosyltransferase involved in cell wall biosynthesis
VKVIHVPFCFRPDPAGGTEVYVEALAREQQRRGLDVLVAAPARETSSHLDAGLRVHRFGVSATNNLSSLYGHGDDHAQHEFSCIIQHEQPDVVHLHAFTSAVSARLAHDLRLRGVQLVFTYHTPTVSCQRGTLLRWGRDVCDGKLDVRACAGCALHGLGLGRKTSAVLGTVPTGVGQVVGALGLAGGPWTGLRMTDLVRSQHAAFRAFVQAMDRVVVLCDWAGALLVRNGVPAAKLVLSRHGLPSEGRFVRHSVGQPSDGGSLRMVFLGRLHPTKGLDILLRAVASLPGRLLELDVYGIVESASGDAYARSLSELAGRDPRIRFYPPVPSDQVPTLLGRYDVVAVPSRWLETGPLVVLEAFAAGVPVIGSKLGGIVELVDDGVNGLLVEPESVADWAATLGKLLEDPHVLRRLRGGVRPPRTMAAVADDMLTIYRELLQPA